MKKVLLGLTFCLFTAFASAQSAASLNGQSFGEGVTAGNLKPVSSIPSVMADKTVADMKITGEVLEVCKKKGCWMTLKTTDGEPMRVTFKDYAFFMPKDIVGKTVALDGVAKKQTISKAQLQHYAKDAKKSPEEIAKINADKDEIAFEAKGVVILDTDTN
jgi:hypothetical protein